MMSGPVQELFIGGRSDWAGTASWPTSHKMQAASKGDSGLLVRLVPKCMKSMKEVSLR